MGMHRCGDSPFASVYGDRTLLGAGFCILRKQAEAVRSSKRRTHPPRSMPEIQMPKLSDGMTEGTIVTWKKKKGDQVRTGEVVAEIETEKAIFEWESPEDGVLTEIYVQ